MVQETQAMEIRMLDNLFIQQDNDPKHTYRLCNGYLTKESDGVLHQMTWPPQSPDHKVKEKQPTSAQNIWELIQDCWKSIPHEAG